MRDKDGRLFVRKNAQIDAELAEKLKNISSPYIVKFVEFGEDGAYVIEEYIDGVTAAEQTLTRKQAVRVLIELCDALNALHSAKIIHRDIKPSNLIIAADGHIKLIDFDASRIAKAVQDKDTQILGTEGFAPPEQFGFSQTDSRSDIYSFGVTMKLLLGENAAQFGNVIRKCTSLDPNLRYQSIVQVKTAIRLASLKRFLFIPIAAAFLAVFTLIISTVLEQKNTIDFIDGTSSESYESSLSSSSEASSEPSSTHHSSSVTQSESSDSIAENSDSSQTSELSESTASPQKSESSVPPESSTSSQTTQSSSTSTSTISSQSSQSSEPSESSTVSQSSQSPEPPESGASSQKSESS